MKVDPSGVVTIGECDLRLPGCRALTPAPVMAILASLGREVAATVCRSCLEEMVRLGEWEIPGAKLSRRFDLAVYDKDERLQLVVDVKNFLHKHEADPEQWATRIRRNLVRHSAVPIYVYFCLRFTLCRSSYGARTKPRKRRRTTALTCRRKCRAFMRAKPYRITSNR